MATVLTSSRPLGDLRAAASRFGRWTASLWHAYPREILAIGLFAAVALVALAAGMIGARNSGPPGKTAPPPAPPPMVVRPIAPDQAVKLNAAIPVASGPNPTAAPFLLKGS